MNLKLVKTIKPAGLFVISLAIILFSCQQVETPSTPSVDSYTYGSENTKAITSFKFLATDNTALSSDVDGSIDETAKTIGLTVPNGTDVTALKPTIVITGVSISPQSGIATDFTNDATYTVTAEDSTNRDYTVTVTIASSDAKSITSFSFLVSDNSELSSDVDGSIAETEKTVGLTVPNGTDVTGLKPTMAITGVSVSPESGVATDFTNDVTYSVTASDSTTRDYTVTVTISGSDIDTCIIDTSTLDNCILE